MVNTTLRRKGHAYKEAWLCLGWCWAQGGWYYALLACRLCLAGVRVRNLGSVRFWVLLPETGRPSGVEDVYLLLLFYFSFYLHAHMRRVSHIDECALSHTCIPFPFSLAHVCATHTQPLTHGVWTPVVSLLWVAHPPFSLNPCPFHTELPVGKTHDFYTAQS